MDRKFEVDAEGVVSYAKWIAATLVAFLDGIPELTWFLIMLMVLDLIFGIGVSFKLGRPSIRLAWEASTRKIYSLGIIVLAALVDQYVDLLGIDLVQVATVFYIGPEILSILRSAAILEVPVPPQFAQVLKAFQQPEQETKK